MRIVICVAIAVSLLTAKPSAQRRTLPEMVRDQNGPINLQTGADPPPISLAELVRRSDIVIRGIVSESTSYLSPDLADVYTDLTLDKVTVLYSAQRAASTMPGPPPSSTIVTQLGGTVTIGGHSVRKTHKNLLPLPRGTNAIFLLVQQNGKFFIAGKYLGVFGIEDNRVVPFARTEWFAREHRGKIADQLIAEIVSIATATQ
jgi:hypothetical protein